MKVYIDVISGDEMISDSYPHKLIFEDAVLEVKSRLTTKGQEDYGISNNDEEDGGAGGSSDAVSVVDVVDAFNLQEITLEKKDFMTYIKQYLPKIKKHLEDTGKAARVPSFQKGATQLVKSLVEKWDEVQVFTGKEYNMEAGYAYCYYADQADSGPTFFYLVDGMREEKC